VTRIAIGVNDEQNILANLSDGLHPDFAVVSTVVLFLQRGVQENARRVVEAKSSFSQVAPALGLVPLKKHGLRDIRFKRTLVNGGGKMRRIVALLEYEQPILPWLLRPSPFLPPSDEDGADEPVGDVARTHRTPRGEMPALVVDKGSTRCAFATANPSMARACAVIS
jgi:hypothetical protein